MLVLYHYRLMAANHSRKGITLYRALLFPCIAVSLAVTVDDEQTGFGLQLLCCRSLTWYVNLVEHRWRS